MPQHDEPRKDLYNAVTVQLEKDLTKIARDLTDHIADIIQNHPDYNPVALAMAESRIFNEHGVEIDLDDPLHQALLETYQWQAFTGILARVIQNTTA